MGFLKKLLKLVKKLKPLYKSLIDTDDREKIRNRTQTRNEPYQLLLLDPADGNSFSFLALGDSGDGGSRISPNWSELRKEELTKEEEKELKKAIKSDSKFLIADEMKVEEGTKAIDFIFHLGDVVYSSGAAEGYKHRFIGPYHHWLASGTNHDHKNMVFKKPFLPIYGNHDYYDIDDAVPLIGDLIGELKDSIGQGSGNGSVFEQAFVETEAHAVQNGQLEYFRDDRTRIPNRYYWFIHGNCAFFALDSNTLEGTPELSKEHRRAIKVRRKKAEKQAKKLKKEVKGLRKELENLGEDQLEREALESEISDRYDDLVEALKTARNLEKFKDAEKEDHDSDQIEWLKEVLDKEEVAGKWKIVCMHHSLFTSDESHTDDAELSGLRPNLRKIFEEKKVDLVLSGHSHCFEWTEELKEEHSPCYVVSGGGGKDLRPSMFAAPMPRDGNPEAAEKQVGFLQVAESKAYAETHHFLRIDVTDQTIRIYPVGIRKGQRLQSFRVNTYERLPSSDYEQVEVKEEVLYRRFRSNESPLDCIVVHRDGRHLHEPNV